MNINPTVLAVIATALVLVLANYAKGLLDKSRQQRAEVLKAQAELAQSLAAFVKVAEKLGDGFAKIDQLPKFMEGFVKVCQAFVMEVSKFRVTTDKLTRLILQGQDGKEALQTPTDTDKDKAYRIMERMAGGEDAETAAQAVEDEELKKTTYGVADL